MGLDAAEKASFLRLVQDNHAGFILEMGSAWVRIHRESGITWTIGASSIAYYNAVFPRTSLSDRHDTLIEKTVTELAKQKIPGTWHVWDGPEAARLEKNLLASGFTLTAREDGMAIRIPSMRTPAVPKGFTVHPVHTEADMRMWMATLSMGFGAGLAYTEWIGETCERIGYGNGTGWHHYIGKVNGHPVSTATVYDGIGLAGLYFVFTLPELRGKGYATALSSAALSLAMERGFRFAVLSVPEKRSMYRELGFQQVGKLKIYTWSPPTNE